MAWAEQLSIMDTVRNVTWDDWRLPSMSVLNGVPTGAAASVVDCSSAAEPACQDNELGYMFYQNLGGALGSNHSPFTNIASLYWSGTEFSIARLAWHFNFNDGNQSPIGKVSSIVFGWAVRSGDVAAVPAPSAMLLMGSGLIGLLAWRRFGRG